MRTRIILVLAMCTLPSLLHASDTLFAYSAEMQKLLNYRVVSNRFDSCIVQAKYGEVSINGLSTTQYVPFEIMSTDTLVQDNSGPGVQHHLLPYLRTEPFSIPKPTSSIRLFRSISFLPVSHNGIVTGSWNFPERTVFVTAIHDAATNERLLVLDSAGYDATPTIARNFTSIGNTTTWCVEASLQSLPDRAAYVIQVTPMRFGSDPFGMDVGSLDESFMQSVYTQCGSAASVSQQTYALFEQELYKRMAEFIANTWRTACVIPNHVPKDLSGAHYLEIMEPYFEKEIYERNGELLQRAKVKPCPASLEKTGNQDHLIPRLHATYGSGSLTIRLTNITSPSVLSEIVESATGKVVARHTVANPGSTYTITNVILATGHYIVRASDLSSGRFATTMITVQ